MKLKILLVLIGFATNVLAQHPQDIAFVQSEFALHYISYTPNSNYIIDFPTKEASNVPNSPFIKLDGKIISVTEYPLTTKDFSNKDEEGKLDTLLLKWMEHEKNHLQTEVYKTTLNAESIFFNSLEQKRFLQWSFEIPTTFRDSLTKANDLVQESMPTHNSFLLFISNNVVVNVSLSTTAMQSVTEHHNYLKELGEQVNVYGGPISKDGWEQQIKAKEKNTPHIYHDSTHHYQIKIPGWVNLTTPPTQNSIGGTFPDINNIKNAFFIFAYKKEEFDSFDAFNQKNITDNIPFEKTILNPNQTWMGHKEMKKPTNCNGVSYRVHSMFGKSIYKCQYITYETPTAYILINFTATEQTFDVNKPKLDELLSGFSIKK